MSTANRPSRVTGALLAAAAGDALGWPQEPAGGLIGGQSARDELKPQPHYRPWIRSGGNRFSGRYSDHVQAGEYSDDTQLLLATARACLIGEGWLGWLTQVELPAWPSYQRGGGRAVLAAANAWAEGRQPWMKGRSSRSQESVARYFQAGANGVAMRIAPHVYSAQHQDDLISRVLQDGIATHGHPRALVGALVYAAAMATAVSTEETLGYGELVSAAMDGIVSFEQAADWLPASWIDSAGSSIRQVWSATNAEMRDLLGAVDRSLKQGALSSTESTLALLGCVDSKVSGAGTVSAAGAVYLASRAAARPMSGLVSAAFARKADTDTLASLTGGLLGAIQGPDWLGELTEVQDETYIRSIARLLTTPETVRGRFPSEAPKKLATKLRDYLSAEPRLGDRGEFPDGRRYVVAGVVELDESWDRGELQLEDGQTAYVDAKRSSRAAAARQKPKATGGHKPPEQSTRTLSHTETQELFYPAGAGPHGYMNLPTVFLDANILFYARVLARNLVEEDGSAWVTDWLRLRRSSEETPVSHQPEVVLETTQDLKKLAIALDAQYIEDEEGTYLLARDPDGRSVRVEAGR